MDPPTDVKKRPRPDRRWLRRAQWLYLAAAVSALVAVKTGGDRWGWATLLSYGPRWVVLLPAVPLLIWAAWRRRVPWATLAAVAVVAGPILQFNVPLARLTPAASGPVALRVMTFNTDTADCDADALARLVADARPDVVALQEWRTPLDAPAWAAAEGWHTRNEWGVMLTSRFPIVQSKVFEGRDIGGEGRVVGCELELPDGRRLWAFSVHLETPRRGFEPLLDGKAGAWDGLGANVTHRKYLSRAAADWIARTAGEGGRFAGRRADFGGLQPRRRRADLPRRVGRLAGRLRGRRLGGTGSRSRRSCGRCGSTTS